MKVGWIETGVNRMSYIDMNLMSYIDVDLIFKICLVFYWSKSGVFNPIFVRWGSTKCGRLKELLCSPPKVKMNMSPAYL